MKANLLSEVIDLASEGFFYPPTSPLSSGTIKILPITAEHEELLTNQNLAKRGVLEETFIRSIVDGDINYDELLYCDKLSILLNARIANYGATAKMKASCSDCDTEFEHDASFIFKSNPFSFQNCTRGVNSLSYVFPHCKKTVKFKLGTCAEHAIYNKHGWLAFAKKITQSIDGVDNIGDFYEYELSARDGALFRKYYEEKTPGYNNVIDVRCPECKKNRAVTLDISTDIFGIRPDSKMQIHAEIFDLCYYSEGAFTQEGVYKMPTSLRNFYIKKLVDAKKSESEAHKKASEGGSQPTKMAKPPSFKK